MKTFTYGALVAHLDPMTGNGLLILPHAEHDMPPMEAMSSSLHAADWDSAMKHLASLGWEPSEDEETGDLAVHGTTTDDRQVVGLFGSDPITSEADLPEEIEAWRDLYALAEVTV